MNTDQTNKRSGKEGSERLSAWVETELIDRLRVRAALDKVSLRSLIERTFSEWLEANPVDQAEVERLTS